MKQSDTYSPLLHLPPMPHYKNTSPGDESTPYIELPETIFELIVNNAILFIKQISFYSAINNIFLYISYGNAGISTRLIQTFRHYIISITLE